MLIIIECFQTLGKFFKIGQEKFNEVWDFLKRIRVNSQLAVDRYFFSTVISYV